MKECILQIVKENLKMFKYNFTDDHNRAWNKFLSFIIDNLTGNNNGNNNQTRQSKETMTVSSPDTEQNEL